MSAMDADTMKALGRALFEAERDSVQMPLVSARHGDMDMDDAYGVQAELVAHRIAAGATRAGWKIGLTSRAMQHALGIDIPDSGVLFEDMFFECGARVPKGRFIAPRIEAEIAFVMAADIAGATATADEVVAATRHVTPAIEILDTRIERSAPDGTRRNIMDTICDNAANAGVVLGRETHGVADFDLRRVGAIVSRNGDVEETGLGAGVLGNPVLGVVWLVHRLAGYGMGLAEGDVVLSGSFVRPIEARGGDAFIADYGAFGSVSIAFD